MTGKIYVNTNSAGVWEVDLATKVKTQIAGGPNASRGDFVTVAPDGTLLITQRDQIARLIPPAGSGFGNFELGINATSPLRSAPVGTSVLITGDAFSRRLSDGVSQAIASVTINGISVDALEVSGKFFAQVQVAAGVNTFAITAIDLSGNTVSTELKIDGVLSQSSFDLVQFADITSSFKGLYFRTSFNEGAKNLLVDLATRNDGAFEIQTPLLVGVKPFANIVFIGSPKVALFNFSFIASN